MSDLVNVFQSIFDEANQKWLALPLDSYLKPLSYKVIQFVAFLEVAATFLIDCGGALEENQKKMEKPSTETTSGF